jgi:hypothetical protein
MVTSRNVRVAARRLTVRRETRCGGGDGTSEAQGVHLTTWGGGDLTEVAGWHKEVKALIGGGG